MRYATRSIACLCLVHDEIAIQAEGQDEDDEYRDCAVELIDNHDSSMRSDISRLFSSIQTQSEIKQLARRASSVAFGDD